MAVPAADAPIIAPSSRPSYSNADRGRDDSGALLSPARELGTNSIPMPTPSGTSGRKLMALTKGMPVAQQRYPDLAIKNPGRAVSRSPRALARLPTMGAATATASAKSANTIHAASAE